MQGRRSETGSITVKIGPPVGVWFQDLKNEVKLNIDLHFTL